MVFSTPHAEGILLLALNVFCVLLNHRLGPVTFESLACTASNDSQQIFTL